jgi:hypothetical protein
MTKGLFGGIIGISAAGVVASIFTNPVNASVMLAGGSGAVLGAVAATEIRRKKQEEALEATKVAENFKQLYENNKGLINPQQLSFTSSITYEQATAFLEALAESEKGLKIPSDKGIVFSFPHPQNILQQLTDNANAWVKSQTQTLEAENATLRQQLMFYELRVKSSQIQNQGLPLMPEASPQVSKTPKEGVDPWSNLL